MDSPLSPSFAPDSPYRQLAHALDGLPNRFPPAPDESDLRLLAKLFTPEQAILAAGLLPEPETPAQIFQRLERDPHETAILLKGMSQNGLIAAGKTALGRLGFSLLPFVVGIYENQNERIDKELAQLFEDYYLQAFGSALEIKPQVHRVIPVGESIPNTMEVQPFESVSGLIERTQAWGVLDCICRKQKALIGQACKHPVDVCLVFADTPEAFAGSSYIRPLTREGAYQTLHRAAQAGLVHCVSNNQRDTWYAAFCGGWLTWGLRTSSPGRLSLTGSMKICVPVAVNAFRPASSMLCQSTSWRRYKRSAAPAAGYASSFASRERCAWNAGQANPLRRSVKRIGDQPAGWPARQGKLLVIYPRSPYSPALSTS